MLPVLKPLQARWWRATAVAVGSAAVVVAVIFTVPVLFGLEPFGLDSTRGDVAQLCAMQQALASGSVWLSPLLGGGSALAAEPNLDVFYPPRWLAWLLAPGTARALDFALHLAFGAAGVALLARTFRARPWLAAAMGAAWALLGPVVDLGLHTGVFVAGAAWGAWIWALGRLVRHPRWAPLAPLLALAVALAELAGDSQALAVACLVVAGESFAHLVRHRRRGLLAFGRVAAAGVIGALLGFVQTALMLGELSLSRRAGGFAIDEALAGSLRGEAAGLLLPGLSDVVVDGASWLQFGGDGGWLAGWYLSAGIVALAIAGAGNRTRSAVVVAVVLAVLSLGTLTPVAPLVLKLVPGASQLRYPAKLLPLVCTAVAVLAAVGLSRPRRRQLVGATLAGLLLLLSAGVVVAVAGPAWMAATLPMLLRAALVLATVVVFAGATRFTTSVPIARRRAVIAAVILLDVAAAAVAFAPWGPPVLALPSLVDDVAGPGQTSDDVVLCVPPSVAGVSLPTRVGGAFDAVAGWRAYGVPGLGACDGVATAPAYQTLQTAMSTEFEVALDDVPAAARALGCTHQLAVQPRPWLSHQPDADIDAVADAAPGRPRLYRLNHALPLVSVPAHPRRCVDEDCTLRALFAAAPDEDIAAVMDDPRRQLGTDAALPAKTWPSVPSLIRTSATTFTLGFGDTVGVGVGGVVVVRQPFLAGWSAWQGDRSLPVVRAAGHLLAVVVDDAGRGPVEFIYQPPGLMVGAAISGLGLVGLVGLWLAGPGLLRRRRQG